jgi:hypothetical protein
MAKLTLRDLFAVVTIVALALGWWLDRSRLARERQQYFKHWIASDQEAKAWKQIADQWERAAKKLGSKTSDPSGLSE